MSNINDTYFDGQYKEIWRSIIPEELTIKEVDFIIPFFGLQAESRVLDLMCGYGRHALALARKGIPVSAVDNLADYINEIREVADREQLPLQATRADVINFSISGQYDLAMCMGNSLNFFDAADTKKLLATIAKHLKPGGKLLINTWSLAEIVFRNFKERSWSTVDGLKFLSESVILFRPARMETESIIIAPDGSSETKKGIDYIFSINEMEDLLSSAGLQMQEVYSIPGRKKFSVGEPRAYIVAEKKQAG